VSATAVSRRIARYDETNAAAAAIVLRDPDRYGKGLVLWAELAANRLVTGNPSRFPELTRAWAHYAARQAFVVRGVESVDGQDEELGRCAWDRR
jgi:hypothetical protein